MTVWVYENGELREARADELSASPVDVSKIKVGDEVSISIPGECFEKFLNSHQLLDELALAVGRAFMAWTSCCDLVLELFISLSKLEKQVGRVVFNRIRSDKMQRDLVLDVGRVRLSTEPSVLDELKNSLRELDKMSANRNVFAHISFGIQFDENWDASLSSKDSVKTVFSGDPIELAKALAHDLRLCERRLFAILVRVNN